MAQNFAMATATCAANGMVLAVVDGPTTQASLTAAGQAAAPTGDVGFWISGQAAGTGEHHDQQTPTTSLTLAPTQTVRVSVVQPPVGCSR